MMWYQVVNAILGLLVMLSPAIWAYESTAANNSYIVGPIVITIALVSITDVARNFRYGNAAAGVWLAHAGFLLDFGNPANYVNLILGILIISFSIPKGKVTHRFGGGWRSLFQSDPEHIKAAEKQP